MGETCRVCADRPGETRRVVVGDGESRAWTVCDGCLTALRDVDWVDVTRTDGDVRLTVAPRGFIEALGTATEEG